MEGLGICNSFYFFDSFVENLHDQNIEITSSLAIFIRFFGTLLPILPSYYVNGRDSQLSSQREMRIEEFFNFVVRLS